MITGLWCIQNLLSVAEIAGACLFVDCVLQQKISGCRKWIMIAGMTILSGLTIYQRTYIMYSRAWLIFSILFCWIFALICCKREKRLICTAYALYYETLYCLDLFLHIGIAAALLHKDFLTSQIQIGVERIVVYLTARILMAVLIVLLYRKKTETAYYFKAGKVAWIIIVAAEHLGLILCDKIFFYEHEEKAIDNWKIIMLLYPFVLILFTFYFIKQKYQKLYEQIRIQNALYSNKYEAMEKKSREKDQIYHDFRNHLILLQRLLLRGELTQAQGYLGNLLKSSGEECEKKTGHPVLDYLLQTKISDAQKKSIQVEEEYDCNLRQGDEESLRDWGVLFGNLWDNAIEGCEEGGEKKKIIFSVKQAGNAIIVKMENTCRPDLNPDKLKTTKTDKKVHGIGLQNVEFIVGKHEGSIKRECRDGIFSTQVIMLE